MRKFALPLLAIAAMLALALSGCGGGPSDAKVTDSGYSVEGDHVTYVAVLKNPNDDYYTNYAHVTFTGLDADNNEVFSSEEIVTLNADVTTAVAGYAVLEGEIDHMDVEITVESDAWQEGALEGDCTLSDIEETPDSIGYYDYSFSMESTYSQDDVQTLQITLVLYDEKDNIIGGDFTYENNYSGQKTSATLPALYTPEHDHFELFVIPVAY